MRAPRRLTATAAGLTLVLAVTWASGAAHAGELPFYAAMCTRTAPHVDGMLDDACWQRAEKTAPFVAIGGAAVGVTTQAMACWDSTQLYLAFVCPEPLMADLAERIAQGKVGPFDESVEVFLDAAADQFSYVQLRVGILGNRDTHRRSDPAEELTGRWIGAARRGADRWTVELAVPFALVGASPGAGTMFNFNVNRQRLPLAGPVEWTCWSDTKGGFHSPARFGHLVFTDYRAWLRQHFRSRLAAEEQRMGDLVLRFPQVAGQLHAELQRLDQEQGQFLGRVAAGEFKGERDCRTLFDEGETLVEAYERSLDEMRLVVIRDVLR